MRMNEEAVSPVIGVILMVAITVILAAVIAAFVFGLAGTTSTTKNVGYTASANASQFQMTLQGGTDVDKLANLYYSIDEAPPFEFYTGKPYVGMVNNTGTSGGTGHRLLITGKFDDGSTQVLFDKKF
jgi:flagellin-like protein